jgi:hypothetical protein
MNTKLTQVLKEVPLWQRKLQYWNSLLQEGKTLNLEKKLNGGSTVH